MVDDEPAVRDAIVLALQLESFDVGSVENGLLALRSLERDPVDAMVLDVAMPYIDGVEVCRRLRAAGDRTPILMLTAKDELDDRVLGLEAGADDYLAKPFALRELVARLNAIMRRTGEDRPGGAVAFADVTLDPDGHRAHRGERLLTLTRTEFLLLKCFLEHPGQVLSRTQIFEAVWGYDFGGESNSLGVYIGYLRRKTEEAGEPRLIHTVRSFGYVLREGS